jgi:RNA polymerase sigma-70 factor (ECF subfamily)
LTDPEVINQARSGDNTAWDTIVLLHQEPVFRLSYLLLGDPDDAADNAQETFIRARRFFHRYNESRELRPWLLSISANLARNRRRSARRYFSALQRWGKTASEPSSPESQALQSVEQQRLWQAIRRLPHKDQRIIYLRFFLEQSVAETAQTLSIAPGTVKSRMHRALEKLRKTIANDFPDLESNV